MQYSLVSSVVYCSVPKGMCLSHGIPQPRFNHVATSPPLSAIVRGLWHAANGEELKKLRSHLLFLTPLGSSTDLPSGWKTLPRKERSFFGHALTLFSF